MKILRVDMTKLQTRYEDLPEDWIVVGGRGLSARILRKEVPPATNPLSAEARLVIACGPLAGTLAPSCGRISVGGKSPLTMGIKETNAGGPTAQKLDKLGIRAIVVEGAPKDGKLRLLVIDKGGATLRDADEYKGMKTYALVEALQKHGKNTAVISIGPAGERKWKGASVAFTDKDGHPARHAGRGGMGAVMGAKGLKAIVVDDSGTPAVPIADKAAFREAMTGWPEVIQSDGQLKAFSQFGTPFGIVALRGLGSMPSKNYSSEGTPGVENIGGEALARLRQERGGRMDGCMPGCIVKCSIIFHDADGKHVTSAFEYETIALLGTNLGIADPDELARMDRFCDEMGLDTIELGSAMGVAASRGKMEMGNAASAWALLEEVEKGTEFGATLGNGVVATARALDVTRIPAFKGQAIPAHDGRVCKAVGVTYATSPMGADHTAGLSYEEPMAKEGKVEKSFEMQVMMGMVDSLGYCLLASPSDHGAALAFLKNLVNARYGLSVSEEDLMEIGRQTLRDELRFNEGAEFSSIHGPDPAFIRNEPLAPTGSVFDVDADEVASIWDRL
jgi:aldehyde:ferredoxin oxidoreductase